MDAIILILGTAVIVGFNALIAFVLGWIFTEVIILPLNFKPFNCRGCLTFWFTVLLNGLFAWSESSYLVSRGAIADPLVGFLAITGVGVLVGLINFLYIKLKFRIYE